MKRVLVADDHPLVRNGLRRIFAGTKDLSVAGEAGNAVEALRKIREADWHVVLLDISMPGKSGVDVLKQIKQERPKLPILILTSHPEAQFAARLIKSGAAGYLNKAGIPLELIAAVRQVIRGERYVSPAVAEAVITDIDEGQGASLHAGLSDQEYQVFLQLAVGKSLWEVAEERFLSVRTVSNYRVRILAKMAMKNQVELVQYAVKHRLID